MRVSEVKCGSDQEEAQDDEETGDDVANPEAFAKSERFQESGEKRQAAQAENADGHGGNPDGLKKSKPVKGENQARACKCESEFWTRDPEADSKEDGKNKQGEASKKGARKGHEHRLDGEKFREEAGTARQDYRNMHTEKTSAITVGEDQWHRDIVSDSRFGTSELAFLENPSFELSPLRLILAAHLSFEP